MTHGPLSTRARLADLALAVYLAPLFEGRRVAVVGPTSGEVARRARVLGAHTVISFGGVGDDIAVRALVPGALAGMYGKLDVIVVPDAGAVPSLPAVLDEARRALGSEGVVVVASEPDDGPVPLESGARGSVGFYDLEDLCVARFANVRMVGRGPFVGYTLATLDEGGDDVALDTRLIDGDPPRPEAFIAVASDSAVALEPLAVVQVPSEVITQVREGATKGLEEELAKRDQKLKEVEAASAERWVKIQRYEHGLKELEEENRKARDRAVRLSKELEDERKLRQRIELDVQMSRRAPELPKTPDHEPELRRLRETAERLERELAESKHAVEVARAEAATAKAAAEGAVNELADAKSAVESARRELATVRTTGEALSSALAIEVETLRHELLDARAQVQTAGTRVADLLRELDETQATEAELRAELDALAERPETPDLTPALDALRAELAATKSALAEAQAHAAVDGEHERLERALAQHSAELTRLRAERAQLDQAVRELTLSLSDALGRDHADEAAELRSRLSAMASVHAALIERAEHLADANAALAEKLAKVEAQAVAAAGELQQARWAAEESARVASQQASAQPGDEVLAAVEAQRQAAAEARNEVAKLYAANVGLEARLVHTTMQLEGARAGYARRVAELEREIDRVMKALEVAATQTRFERDASEPSLTLELALARAERDGIARRLDESERAIREIPRGVRTVEVPVEKVVERVVEVPVERVVEKTVEVPVEKVVERVVEKTVEVPVEKVVERVVEKVVEVPAKPAIDPAVVQALRDENATLATQLTDAERRLDELTAAPRLDVLSEPDPSAEAAANARMERVMADLAATAERLARTEEELTKLRAELADARAQSAAGANDEDLVELRAEIDMLVRRCDDLTRDRDRRLADVEAVLAQLSDRDQRLAGLERRREEELAGAQRLIMMEAQANRSLRSSLDDVRAGLSAILVDGRGAMVAHDLMTLLRRIEEAG